MYIYKGIAYVRNARVYVEKMSTAMSKKLSLVNSCLNPTGVPAACACRKEEEERNYFTL